MKGARLSSEESDIFYVLIRSNRSFGYDYNKLISGRLFFAKKRKDVGLNINRTLDAV